MSLLGIRKKKFSDNSGEAYASYFYGLQYPCGGILNSYIATCWAHAWSERHECIRVSGTFSPHALRDMVFT